MDALQSYGGFQCAKMVQPDRQNLPHGQPSPSVSKRPPRYAYRPGRSCQMAVGKAELFINRYGLKHVVDMDLSKCFDRLDHELILQGVNRRISDGLDLIREFLKAGVMQDGSWTETEIGSPQGGVISPLLCNIYLDAFDQKMMAQGLSRSSTDSCVGGSTTFRSPTARRSCRR